MIRVQKIDNNGKREKPPILALGSKSMINYDFSFGLLEHRVDQI